MRNVAKIAGGKTTLTADQIVGKGLWAKKAYKEYVGYPDSNNYNELPAGQFVGYVDSWVQRPNGVWWQFRYTDGSYYYVKHDPNLFDYNKLQSQFPNGQFPPQPKIDIPVWAIGAASVFSLYQAGQPENSKYKMLWQLGGFGLAAYGVATLIGKIDFNPFDDILGNDN